MRALWLVVLTAVAVGFALAADPAAPVAKGLLVHEWGVIRVYNDVELANADMRSTWEGLPKFVYGMVDQRHIPIEVVLVNAPVMYFHAPQELALHVKVEFPGGRPAVWWPGNSNIDHHGGRFGALTERATCDKHLEWQLTLNPPQANRPAYQPLPKGHWMEACRAVQAADFITRAPWRNSERERFLYYDGLVGSPKAAELTVTKDAVGLSNPAKHALLDVTVVDRRLPGKVRVARVAQLDAGAAIKTLEFTESPADRWPAAAIDTLLGQLSAAGLNRDEAGSLVEVWKKDFFETEGLGLFYRLPQAEYDRLLPLTITPRPEKVTRTMLVQRPHCEPDLAERVAALVKLLDSNNFQERLDGQRRLQALGHAAFVHLVRARNAKPSLEVTARLNKLLEEFEAERGFKPLDPAER